MSADVELAIRSMVREPRGFPLSPNVDIFERIVTPGASTNLANLFVEAQITDPTARRFSEKVLEDQIIPAHEIQGHIEANLNPDKCFWEPQLIWLFLIQCSKSSTKELFLDFCDKWDNDILTQSCVVGQAHEVYALLREEELWERLVDLRTPRADFSKLRGVVRGKQNRVAVRALNLLAKVSNGDLGSVRRIIDRTYLANNVNLSFSLPHMLRDLKGRVEIDKLPEFLKESTAKAFYGKYTPEQLQKMLEQQRETIAKVTAHPTYRALLSTYVS